MLTLEYVELMCRYNQWMNERLYAVCATMPDDLRKADKGAFFKSVHGTLNHILLADRVWLTRFQGGVPPYRALDQELYSDYEELRRERALTDTAIADWGATLTLEKLASTLNYTALTSPIPQSKPLWLCVTHAFNHQTHHRGQLTTLMEQLGYDSGVTDLIWMASEQSR